MPDRAITHQRHVKSGVLPVPIRVFRQRNAGRFQQARLLARLHGLRGLRKRFPGFYFHENQRLLIRHDKVNFTGLGAQPLRQH